MIKRILWLSLLMLAACGRQEPPPGSGEPPGRIIAFAPNITDMLYDLGLEDRLVGISRFSSGNHQADLPVVGDFMTINYEAVVSLRPDLVILEKSADAQKARLQSLHIPWLETDSLTLESIFASIIQIGETCAVPDRAQALVAQLQQQIQDLRNTPGHRPRILLTFGEFSSASEVEQVYAFGADCIHSELLAIAGGENVVSDARPSVTLSREAIIRLNPDLIIELTGGGPANHWDNLPSVDAVRNHRVYVLDGPYTCIPSPNSLMQTLNDFSRIVRQNDLGAE